MSPALLLLLIAQSYRRPAEHAWCRDDEDVSHDHANVWRILNGTKYYTEQSATPYTWWGSPLESVGATSWIHFLTQNKVPHRAKCHTVHVVGATSWICGATSWIHFPHRAKCHTEQSVTQYMCWGPPLESVGATVWICGATSSLLPVPPGVSVIRILSAY